MFPLKKQVGGGNSSSVIHCGTFSGRACFAVLLRLHLCHVGGDEGAPVSSLQIEPRESQTLHQFQENSGGSKTVKS